MAKNTNNQGFTLNELLVIVGIIAIISMVLLRNINPLQQFFRGYDTVRRNDLQKLKTAFENYFSDNDCYPDPDVLTQCNSNVLEPYLDKIPCDPSSGEPYEIYSLPVDSSCPQKYSIYGDITSSLDSRGDDITYCPKTIAVSSVDMNYLDIINGCSGTQLCQTIYGCRNGACVIIAEDSIPTCSPNSCDPTCGVDCTKKNRRNQYTNECRAI